MAIDGINITLEELTNAANNIRRRNDELNGILANIKNQMNNLRNTWESEAARNILATFSSVEPKFQQYFDVIASYADFLDKTVLSYQSTESTNVANAAAFQ